MIEIEKKFLIDQSVLKKITTKAKLISQRRLVDIYYDTADFKLTTRDWWLRNRNGKFELKKIVCGSDEKNTVDRYEEIIDDKEICKHLKVDFEKSLTHTLKIHDISPFAKIIAKREKYIRDNLTIVFDITDFGYSICEVELVVEDASQIKQALEKIEKFRIKNDFSSEPVRGKLVEYIYRNRPQHYQSLQVAGVIRD